MLTETLHTAFFRAWQQKTVSETALSGRKLCEDFAPRNEGIRPRGERGANRPARPPAKLRLPAGNCVKILLPLTKTQGLAGNGEQTGRPVYRPRAAISESRSPWFAYGNRNQWLSGEASANHAGPRAGLSEIPGPWLAHENRNQRVSRESRANRRRPPGRLIRNTRLTPKNNFEKNKKSTGQEGGSSV